MGWRGTHSRRAGLAATRCLSAPLRPRRSGAREAAFLWIDGAQAFDRPEPAVFSLTDVHVHPEVVLPWHHLSRTTWPVGDARVVECCEDVVLVERPGLLDRRLP